MPQPKRKTMLGCQRTLRAKEATICEKQSERTTAAARPEGRIFGMRPYSTPPAELRRGTFASVVSCRHRRDKLWPVQPGLRSLVPYKAWPFEPCGRSEGGLLGRTSPWICPPGFVCGCLRFLASRPADPRNFPPRSRKAFLRKQTGRACPTNL